MGVINELLVELILVSIILILSALSFLLDYTLKNKSIKLSIRFIFQSILMSLLIVVEVYILIYCSKIMDIYIIMLILTLLLERSRFFIKEFGLREKYFLYTKNIYLLTSFCSIIIFVVFRLKFYIEIMDIILITLLTAMIIKRNKYSDYDYSESQ